MRFEKSKIQLCAVVVVAIGVVGYGVWGFVTDRKAVRGIQSNQKLIDRENKEVLRDMESLGFDEISGIPEAGADAALRFPFDDNKEVVNAIQSVEAVLNDSEVLGDAKGREQLAKSLERAAAEFVYFRFIRNDAKDYLAWRIYRGDQLKDPEVIYGKKLVASDYESYFGEPFPEGLAVEDAFVKIYNFHKDGYGAAHQAVGMSIDKSGLVVGIDRMNPAIGFDRVDLGSDKLNTFWYEPALGSHRGWFDSGIDFEKSEEVYTGLVGILVRYADGSLRPVIVVALLDPSVGYWAIHKLWTNNYGQTGGLIEF